MGTAGVGALSARGGVLAIVRPCRMAPWIAASAGLGFVEPERHLPRAERNPIARLPRVEAGVRVMADAAALVAIAGVCVDEMQIARAVPERGRLARLLLDDELWIVTRKAERVVLDLESLIKRLTVNLRQQLWLIRTVHIVTPAALTILDRPVFVSVDVGDFGNCRHDELRIPLDRILVTLHADHSWLIDHQLRLIANMWGVAGLTRCVVHDDRVLILCGRCPVFDLLVTVDAQIRHRLADFVGEIRAMNVMAFLATLFHRFVAKLGLHHLRVEILVTTAGKDRCPWRRAVSGIATHAEDGRSRKRLAQPDCE